LPVVFIGAGLVSAPVLVFLLHVAEPAQQRKPEIKRLTAQQDGSGADQACKSRLRETKGNLAAESSTIEQLQRDRTGGQELLDMVANTYRGRETSGITEMIRRNTLSLEARLRHQRSRNFINRAEAPGYFQKVESRKQAGREERGRCSPSLFRFPAEDHPPAAVQTRPANAPAPGAAAKAPAKKG